MALPTLLRISDIAQAFGVVNETVENWVRVGSFPAGKKIGGSRFWSEAQISSWLDAQDAPTEKNTRKRLAAQAAA